MLYGDDEDTRSFKNKGKDKVPGVWNQVQHVPTSTSRTHLEFALLSMLTMLHNVDKAFSRRCFFKLQWVSKQIAPVGEKILINTFHWKKNHHAEKSEYRNSFFHWNSSPKMFSFDNGFDSIHRSDKGAKQVELQLRPISHFKQSFWLEEK